MSERAATVLVVDDNPGTRYSTGRFLRAAGFKVIEAKTGHEAIAKAESAPDAVVLDVNLPDLDGFAVCRVLRANERTARIPIIHLSATFRADSDKVQGLEAGANGYLTHPVEPEVLVATVNAFLRARDAEERMRRSEEKFRAIFDQAVNGIALLDEELRYLEVNPAMCRMLARAPEQILGRSNADFVATESELQLGVIAAELARSGVWTGNLPLLRPDGRAVDLEWNVSTHTAPGVRMAVVTDITERTAAEAERERLLASERAARSEAERANRLKDEFLATVSHELRSPLNAIVGWAQILKSRGAKDPGEYEASVEAIHRNAKVQAQLIADLLDVSSITSGKLRLDLAPVDLGEVARHALASVERPAAAKSITVEARLEPRPIRISGDAGRLQQVLDNLLTNALKFTPSGGRITVTSTSGGGFAQVSVADTGQGIKAEFLPYVFDTFRQEDAATTRVHGGLGLGLAIVKRLVDKHGGTIEARSAGEQQGSVFVVRLPLLTGEHPGAADAPAAATQVDLGVLRSVRALVVDDDADARMLVRRFLVEYGVEIFEAASAAEALALLETADPHVLLSDISMPGDDGYSLVARVRASGRTPERLPAIALTAFAGPGDRSRALAEGFQAHIAKPIDIDVLVGTIATLVGRAPDTAHAR